MHKTPLPIFLESLDLPRDFGRNLNYPFPLIFNPFASMCGKKFSYEFVNKYFFLIVNFVNFKLRNTFEAGATFDNSFIFLRQFKNRSFLEPVFVHVTGQSQN